MAVTHTYCLIVSTWKREDKKKFLQSLHTKLIWHRPQRFEDIQKKSGFLTTPILHPPCQKDKKKSSFISISAREKKLIIIQVDKGTETGARIATNSLGHYQKILLGTKSVLKACSHCNFFSFIMSSSSLTPENALNLWALVEKSRLYSKPRRTYPASSTLVALQMDPWAQKITRKHSDSDHVLKPFLPDPAITIYIYYILFFLKFNKIIFIF